ncbi:hypothetical protein ACQKMN_17110 [Ureibacillus composti]
MINNILIIIFAVVIIVFSIALYALILLVFGIESDDKANIISGILGMTGGVIGAIGAYFVATYQMSKQFEFERNKEEKQKLEIIEQTLKKLELLNNEVIEFIDYFKEEFSKRFDEERNVRLKFGESDLLWIVNNVNNINDEILMEGYALDYLRFSRELNNMYIDVIGINFLPEEQRPENIVNLIASMLKRRENFVSFDLYVKEHIKDIQKELEYFN